MSIKNIDLECEIYKNIPDYVIWSLDSYIEERLAPGSFLMAVLENNLFTAVSHADPMSIKALKGIVTLLHCHVRSDIWGNKEKVNDWLKGS